MQNARRREMTQEGRNQCARVTWFILKSFLRGDVWHAPKWRRPVPSISKDHNRRYQDEWIEVQIWIRTKHEEV